MARSEFSYTVVAADVINAAGIGAPIKALENIEYNVYKVDSSGNRITSLGNRPATYASRTSQQDLGYSGTTEQDGVISFWADPGEYEIEIEDTIAPARISNRTITWSSVAAADGSISGDYISNDSQLDLATLGDDILHQLVPVGTVLDWWRPANSNYQVPDGFVICKGDTYEAGEHDFGTNSAITVPDLRNKFILGASISKADNATATLGSVGASEADPTNAPGIGGKGGTNGARDLTHNHNVPTHYHGRGTLSVDGVGNHSHSGTTSENGDHYHGVGNVWRKDGDVTAGADYIGNTYLLPFGGWGQFTSTNGNHTHTFGTSENGSHGHTLSGSIGATASGRNGDSGFNTDAASGNISATHDFRPSYYGLLKIIKIKRA